MPGNSVGLSTVTLDDSSVTTSENTTGEFSTIIDIEVPRGYRYEFVPGQPLQMYVPTHETFSQGASATDTHNLSNNIVNSPALRDVETSSSETEIKGPRSLVVWDDEGNHDFQTGVNSVDYAGNSFDYTDSNNAGGDLEVYYLWVDSAQVEFRHYTPSEEDYDKQLIRSMRSFHQANVHDRPGWIRFPEPFTMMEREHLKVTVKTDVDLSNWDAQSGDGSSNTPGDIETYGYPDLSLPVRKVPMKR